MENDDNIDNMGQNGKTGMNGKPGCPKAKLSGTVAHRRLKDSPLSRRARELNQNINHELREIKKRKHESNVDIHILVVILCEGTGAK